MLLTAKWSPLENPIISFKLLKCVYNNTISQNVGNYI